VVIDTVTMLQSKCVEKVLTDNKKGVENAGRWGSMTKGQWGDVAQLMKHWLVLFRDLPIEVVFLAQDRLFNFDDEADTADDLLAPEIGPRLSPSIAAALNAAVNVIGNTFIRVKEKTVEVKGKKIKKEVIQYCLRVGPSPVYVTKVRKPKKIVVPDVILDPEYDDIINAIEGE
jgi:hypothetical protein